MSQIDVVCVEMSAKNKKQNEKRMKAGIEWAADMDEWMFVAPQKYVLLGLCAALIIISIVSWIGSGYYAWTVWAMIATFCLGLIIFIPDYFCNVLNLILNFACWCAFLIFVFVNFIQIFVWKGNEHNDDRISKLNFMLACVPFEIIVTVAIILIVFRIMKHAYENR